MANSTLNQASASSGITGFSDFALNIAQVHQMEYSACVDACNLSVLSGDLSYR
jgi:hypothetical protein